MFPKGKRILQAVAQFQSRKWPGKDIELLADKITDHYQTRNEIISGGVVSSGAGTSSSALPITTSALNVVLRGRMMAVVAAQTAQDLFTTAGVFTKAIYEDGADASGVSLSADGDVAHVTVIVCNTDGSGGAVETDNGACKLLAVVAGTAADHSSSAHLSSQAIQDALDAATDLHDGVTGWAHVCQIVWTRVAVDNWTVAIVMNRNNVPQGA